VEYCSHQGKKVPNLKTNYEKQTRVSSSLLERKPALFACAASDMVFGFFWGWNFVQRGA
jgi:hypothetical protein